jgi:nucleotide-binding universal stress UspA family protein
MLHYVVATDGSESASRAVQFAAELAARVGARLTLVHVLPTAEGVFGEQNVEIFEEIQRRNGEKLLDDQRKLCGALAGSVEVLLLQGEPVGALKKAAAERKAHLLVVGTRGLGVVGRALLGSVSSKLAHGCDRPLVIVP